MSYSYASAPVQTTWTDHLGRDSPCGGRASRCYTFKLTDPLNPSLPSMLVPDVVKRCLEDPVHVDPKELVVGMRVLGYEETDVEDAIFLVVFAHKERAEHEAASKIQLAFRIHRFVKAAKKEAEDRPIRSVVGVCVKEIVGSVLAKARASDEASAEAAAAELLQAEEDAEVASAVAQAVAEAATEAAAELVRPVQCLTEDEAAALAATRLAIANGEIEDELEEVPELVEEPFSAVFVFSGKAVVIPVKGTSAYSDVFPLLRHAFFDKYRIKKMPEVEICYNGKALDGPCGLAAQSFTAPTTLFELGVVCRRRISNPEPVGQS